jgi:hypothetical protein
MAIMMLTDSVDLEHVLQEEQGVELAGVPDHGLAGGEAEQREQAILAFFHWPKASDSGALELLALFLHLLEGRRFVQRHADPDRDAEQHDRDEERNAPAPGGEVFLAEHGLDARMTISDRNRPSVAVVWIQDV